MAAPASPASGDRQPLPARSYGTRPRRSFSDLLAWLLPHIPAFVPLAILLAIIVAIVSATQFTNFGWGFFGLAWNPAQNQWGIGVYVVGSFLTSVPALFFSLALGTGIAVASTVYVPGFVSRILDPFVDLLAGIPSVVYGIWAFIVVAPFFGGTLEPWLASTIGFIPGFGPPAHSDGVGVLLSVFILTLMSLPITTLLIRDALRSVPRDLWESGLALGATRWEVVRRVAIPYGRRGIWSAAFLGFGRAFGETVAVAMVIGSATKLPASAYDTGNTMPATMFDLLDSAIGGTGSAQFLAALAEMACVLLAIALAVNLIGRRLISSLYREPVQGL